MVAVTSVALSACGATRGSGGVVPWAALAPSPTTATTSSTTTAPKAPPCRARQLRARLGRGEAGLGNEETVVVLTNVGPLCRLSGYPDLEGQTTSPRWRPIRVRKIGTYFGDLNATNVAPGRSGLLLLGTSVTCNALNAPSQSRVAAHERAFTYRAIRIMLPGHQGTVSVTRISLDVACGLDESHLGARPPQSSTAPPRPGTVATLSASVSLPTALRSLTTLSYVVALHNPSATAVAFAPCPNVTEEIFLAPSAKGARPDVRTFALNCADAAPVAPHGTERFAMELKIPRSLHRTQAKFAWALDTGSGPFFGRAIRVLPPRGVLP